MRYLITYFDEDSKLRTTYAVAVKKLPGCLRFVAVTPSGDFICRRQMSDRFIVSNEPADPADPEKKRGED